MTLDNQICALLFFSSSLDLSLNSRSNPPPANFHLTVFGAKSQIKSQKLHNIAEKTKDNYICERKKLELIKINWESLEDAQAGYSSKITIRKNTVWKNTV